VPRLTMRAFCDAVAEVLAELPEPFHAWLENTVVDVEREPSRRLLRELGMGDDETLFGLFEGRAVTEQEFGEVAPNRVRLFKNPIEEASRSAAEIRYEIRRTVLHELAHHFGYSEEDLDEFEARPSPFDASEDPPGGDVP
jgi:predicted Zn-dependent protease with MMP-like domain